MRLRAALVVAVLVTTVWAAWWLDHYRWAGGFREVRPHFAGTCRPVEGVPGPEDLLIDHVSAIAYVSSYDRGAVQRGKPVPGAILAYDLKATNPTPRNLTPSAGADFRPHGISLYRERGQKAWLHVINHPSGGDTIEVFELHPDRLIHVRTIRGQALTSANDLVAVGFERFYVTNSRGYTDGFRGRLEAAFRLAWGNVMYYDGTRFSVALERVAFPNGIAVSPDARQLYLVSSFDQAVHVYGRDAASGALTHRRSVKVGTRLDNVNVTPDGALWVAGRAQYLDPPQPSQVVRITDADSDTARVHEVYVNDGGELAGASAAAAHEGRLLIGASRGTRFLDCVMK